MKSANPTELVGGGEVTYTYEVRNTGDVPLAGVADSITDDTCSPVTYVRGDHDDDGLLDTPNSIFEDRLDETWVFTCTTDVDEDTTNTVVVAGRRRPGRRAAVRRGADAGTRRCGTDLRPTDRDRAHVIVTPDNDGLARRLQDRTRRRRTSRRRRTPDTGAPPWLRALLASASC